jgi:4-hydroxythreonine-4-phosphate dehydrogenase
VDAGGDLMALLAAAGLRVSLLRCPLPEPARIEQAIAAAVAEGAGAIVVDGRSDEDLARLAQVCGKPGPAALLLAGSAGLARALAAVPMAARRAGEKVQAELPAQGPVLTLAGSFSEACAAQVRQVEASMAALVIRLDSRQWLAQECAADRRRAIERAGAALASGRDVLLAIAGEVTQPFSRGPVRAMAGAAVPLLRQCGVCVLTGGDTARALLDQLGVTRLEVSGEFEPGISVASAPDRPAPRFVLKAGGFGDAGALQRIIAHFGISISPAPARPHPSS